MSDSLWSHKWQHNTLPRPSLSPWVCSNSCPLSQWCHPTISISVTPFTSCPQSFPASGSFLRSKFFASGGQIIGASASALVHPVNIQGWFPLGLADFISLQFKGRSRVISTTFQMHQFLAFSLFCGSTLTSMHDYWKKTYLWLYRPLLAKWCLCFLICFLGW